MFKVGDWVIRQAGHQRPPHAQPSAIGDHPFEIIHTSGTFGTVTGLVNGSPKKVAAFKVRYATTEEILRYKRDVQRLDDLCSEPTPTPVKIVSPSTRKLANCKGKWLVWSPSGTYSPRVLFDDHMKAHDAAHDMANRHGGEFYAVQIRTGFVAKGVPKTTTIRTVEAL